MTQTQPCFRLVFEREQKYLRWKELNQPCLFLDLDEDQSHLFVVSAQQVELARPIPIGINSMYPALQQQLGLKDEESARKLFDSDTFDFKEIAGELLRKLLRELQASVGFYEVQTGQTLTGLFINPISISLDWVSRHIGTALNLKNLEFSYRPWLQASGIDLAETAAIETLDARGFGLVSLLLPNEETDATESATKA